MSLRLVVLGTIAVTMAAPRCSSAALTLDQASAEARSRSTDLALVEGRLAAAERLASIARKAQRHDPELALRRAPGRLTGNPDEGSWGVELGWTLDVSGSWRPRGASAQQDVERAGRGLDDALRDLDERVATGVAELAGAQRAVAREARLAELAKELAGAERQRIDAGTGTQLDLDGADLDAAAAESDLRAATADVARARWELARLLGRETAADLDVEDPVEKPGSRAPRPDLDAMVAADPRVLGAAAERQAAQLGLEAERRSAWPKPTIGAGYTSSRHDIPEGSFTGLVEAGAGARWSDSEVELTIGLPLPLFDRNLEGRARATERAAVAAANERATRLQVRSEIEAGWQRLELAEAAMGDMEGSPAILAREEDLLHQALAAGALDAPTRALSLRRLEEHGRRFDVVVHELRLARARWQRLSSAPPHAVSP